VVNSKIARKLLCASAALMMGAGGLAVTASAQDADAKAERYSAVLEQIANAKLSITQKQAYVANQKAQIESLRSQINGLPAEKEKIRPIVTEMVAAIEKQMQQDLPFRQTERFNRLDKLKEDLANPEVGESALFRQAITIFDIEVGYGNSVGSYTGDNPINPGGRLAACKANSEATKCALTKDQTEALEKGATIDDLADSLLDGNYIHFGRLSLGYLDLDSSEGYLYNKETKAWDKLSSGDILGIRKAIRISRGESAPGTVRGPVDMDIVATN